MGLFSRNTTQDGAAPTSSPIGPAEPTNSGTPPVPPTPPLPSASTSGPSGPLVTNTIVQSALLKWGEAKNAQTMNEVLRHCVTGELLVDISGSQFADVSKGLQPGDTLGVGQVIDNAGKRLLLVYTSNDAVQAYRPGVAPMSLAQPASGVMKQALSDFDGIAIDPASPNSCIIYNSEIQRGLSEEPSINEPLKTGLSANLPGDQIRELAASAPLLFIGVAEVRNEEGEIIGATLPSVKTTAGEVCPLAFTSPAEVWAFDATLSARPTGIVDVIAGAKANGYHAVMLNPMGPWAMLRVEEFDES